MTDRLELLEEHRVAVRSQIRELRRALRAIDEKIVTYQEMKDAYE